MPTQTVNRPWVAPAFGNDFAMQQPQQQPLYQTQLQGSHIDLQPRRNSPMRNQPSGIRGGYTGLGVSHSERIPIRTADGRFVGGAQPQQAPAAQNIPIRQPLYHHPPILPQHQSGPLVPQRSQMPGQFSSPPQMQRTQLNNPSAAPQQRAQLNNPNAAPATAIPASAHSHLHGHAQAAHPPSALPMWFGGGKAPAGYETAPAVSTVPFSSSSHPVLQMAPHPSPFPVKIHEALAVDTPPSASSIPMPSAPPTPHPFLKAHSQPQRISPPRVNTNLNTSIPVRSDHVIGSSSANIKPGFSGTNIPYNFPSNNTPANIRGGYGAQQQLQRTAPQPAGQAFSPQRPQAAPMWFGDGPTPPFYQRPTEPWHFTFNGKEPIAKAPASP